MSSEIGAALSGLVGLVGVAKAAMDTRDWAKLSETSAKLNEQIIKAQQAVIDGQSTQAALVAKLAEANEKIRQLEAAAAKKAEHRVVEVDEGVFVLELLDNREVFQVPGVGLYRTPKRYACQPCLEVLGKSVLLRYHPGNEMCPPDLTCPSCKTSIGLSKKLT
ncbi:hypothetical protein PSQ39_21335 [Curvibacter sp. HBC28]|uniref:Uncharacterized protein n=1 Tax=Curvibacter microcysteis TaxID=3026419 RepID=A0ABT5MKT1_9BURK|nr:hypothetical protein [Curvibacter sp. HBC28]MDD0817192.1 hypothetical protein [Curvibacter sp. HBC28]